MKTSSLLRRVKSLFASKSQSAASPILSRQFSGPEPLEERFVLSSFVVTNLNNGGPGSLRAAIFNANATPAADSIVFQSGLSGTLTLAGGELHITAPVTITGPGSDLVKISGNNALRVFEIDANKTVSISGLDITHGLAASGTNGGGILNNGILTLTNDTFDSNTVAGIGYGGAIFNGASGKLAVVANKVINNSGSEGAGIANTTGGSASIVRTFISNNHGFNDGDGAGIFNAGTMAVRICTISGNVGVGSVFDGAAIRNNDTLSVVASTIANNISQGSGGGIFNVSTVAITNSTIVNNTSLGNFGGGAIYNYSGGTTISGGTITGNIDASGAATGVGGIGNSGGTISLNNSVLADNFASGSNPANIRSAVTGSGNFIAIGDSTLTGITNGTNGNQIGTTAAPIDAKLGPLQYNGGLTATRLPLPGSPLINKGVNAVIPAGLTTDQRGFARIVFGTVDIGSVEF